MCHTERDLRVVKTKIINILKWSLIEDVGFLTFFRRSFIKEYEGHYPGFGLGSGIICIIIITSFFDQKHIQRAFDEGWVADIF